LHFNQTDACEVGKKLDWNGTEWENRANNIGALITFIEEVATIPEENAIKLKYPVNNLKISEDMFGENLDTIREQFSNNKFIWLRIPVKIKPVSKKEQESYFDVYLQKDNSLEESEEFYVREGITISDIQSLRGRRVRGLLSADDAAISDSSEIVKLQPIPIGTKRRRNFIKGIICLGIH